MLACLTLLGAASIRSPIFSMLDALASWPDIHQVAMRALEFLHPLLGIVIAGSGLLLIQSNKAFLNVRGHSAGITAHVDNSSLLKQVPDIVLLRPYGVLHVYLRL